MVYWEGRGGYWEGIGSVSSVSIIDVSLAAFCLWYDLMKNEIDISATIKMRASAKVPSIEKGPNPKEFISELYSLQAFFQRII
jgi:hypothetical protein